VTFLVRSRSFQASTLATRRIISFFDVTCECAIVRAFVALVVVSAHWGTGALVRSARRFAHHWQSCGLDPRHPTRGISRAELESAAAPLQTRMPLPTHSHVIVHLNAHAILTNRLVISMSARDGAKVPPHAMSGLAAMTGIEAQGWRAKEMSENHFWGAVRIGRRVRLT
jgi:hypothetical protein